MEIYNLWRRRAIKLVDDLQKKCNSETICENYGQKEIGKFIDEMSRLKNGKLSYQEQCEIKDILYKVSSIADTPKV